MNKQLILIFVILFYSNFKLSAQQAFKNPITMEWLDKNLNKNSPRLIFTYELEKQIRENLPKSKALQEHLNLIRSNAEAILKEDVLKYEKEGKRLLSVSRDAVGRMLTLSIAYRFDKDERFLKRLEQEITSACNFPDWNPSHFLDVAEMATAISLSMDWCDEWLSPELKKKVQTTLVEKALKPGLAITQYNWWFDAAHNWNSVCFGGLAVAALYVYETEPEIASYILHHSVEKIPLGLEAYGPDGVYPEGPGYWFYGTSYLIISIATFQTALNTDFDFLTAPGLKESTLFSQVTAGPSGNYYNFFDAKLKGFQQLLHLGMLAWFAQNYNQSFNNQAYNSIFQNEITDKNAKNRFSSLAFLFIGALDLNNQEKFTLPDTWLGQGNEPVFVFRSNKANSLYLAGKGGKASDNHGNMDVGSFIFELDGVRWSIDLGLQKYYELEEIIGVELWNNEQNSKRWSLISKNNFGHSTLTINKELHIADARVNIENYNIKQDKPQVTLNMTPVFNNNLAQAHRTFQKISENSLQITDKITPNEKTESITWQFLTLAEVKIKKDKIILTQNKKTLYLTVKSPEIYTAKVVSLSPPPLEYDMNIPNLKRIEIEIDKKNIVKPETQIIIELSNEK